MDGLRMSIAGVDMCGPLDLADAGVVFGVGADVG